MIFTTISTSEGRKKLPQIIKEVDQQGKIYIFTTHGKAKVAIVDMELFNEFIENTEYGISAKEIVKRTREKTISLQELKSRLNL